MNNRLYFKKRILNKCNQTKEVWDCLTNSSFWPICSHCAEQHNSQPSLDGNSPGNSPLLPQPSNTAWKSKNCMEKALWPASRNSKRASWLLQAFHGNTWQQRGKLWGVLLNKSLIHPNFSTLISGQFQDVKIQSCVDRQEDVNVGVEHRAHGDRVKWKKLGLLEGQGHKASTVPWNGSSTICSGTPLSYSLDLQCPEAWVSPKILTDFYFHRQWANKESFKTELPIEGKLQ